MKFISLQFICSYLVGGVLLVIQGSQRLDVMNTEFVKLLVPQTNVSCDRPWPKISLYVPVNMRLYSRYMHARTAYEWRDIFLTSFLIFWPIRISKTNIVFMVDEELKQNNYTLYETFDADIKSCISRVSSPPSYKIVSNNFSADSWCHDGGMR